MKDAKHNKPIRHTVDPNSTLPPMSIKPLKTYAYVDDPGDHGPLSLAYASQDFFSTLERDTEALCPCCNRNSKPGKRRFSSNIARVLMLLYKLYLEDPDGFFHIERVILSLGLKNTLRGDFAKMKHFSFIEQAPGKRKDGNTKNGYWKITEIGVMFVEGKLLVPKEFRIYDDALYWVSEETISIMDALRSKGFDYNEMMDREIPADFK